MAFAGASPLKSRLHRRRSELLVTYQWDNEKAATNEHKHGLSFFEGASVLDGRLLVAVYTYPFLDSGDERIRIISRRRPTPKNERCILMGDMQMKDEHDVAGGKRGVFYHPGQAKRYVITLDHKPPAASFEISQDRSNRYICRLTAHDGTISFTSESFPSRDDAMASIQELRGSILAAETVETR